MDYSKYQTIEKTHIYNEALRRQLKAADYRLDIAKRRVEKAQAQLRLEIECRNILVELINKQK